MPRNLGHMHLRPFGPNLPRSREAALRVVRAWPRLRATEAYGHLMAQRGGCAKPYGRVLPIIVGGPGAVWGQQHELHLCVVVEGRLRGDES